MNCPECGNEMRQGFLFATKDGAFSFADEVPSMLKNAKHAAGFVEITPVKPNHRTRIEAYCCEDCRLVQFHY
ncbi:MAG: PF20097 family protein [Actinomycetota bacterium]|nr:PF20097 family protein [Actinomycetota bacterium]